MIKIGEYPAMGVPAARDEAKLLAAQIAVGQKGKTRASSTRDELTLGELFAWYMTNHAKPHKRTWREDQRNFEKRLQQWSGRRLSEVTKEMVKNLHVKIAEKKSKDHKLPGGTYAANKMLELLGFMFRLGHTELGIAAPDPTEGIKRFPRRERDRFLTYEELPRFLQAVDRLTHKTTRDYIYCALLIGARRSNLAAMKWADIDFHEKVWRVGADEAKGKVTLRIVLPPDAIEILLRRKAESNSPWVFPGAGKTGHIVDPRSAMRVALFNAGITPYASKKDAYTCKEVAKTNHVRFHDLRRTLGSWQAAQGTSLLVIAKTLGHQSLSAAKVYARLDLEPARASVEMATSKMMDAKNSFQNLRDRSEDTPK